MANRIVMGYWDCPFCETKGIKGTLRACPNCGRPRGENTEFYMKESGHAEVVSHGAYLSDAEAATKGKGEDWQCSYCGGLNSALDTVCKSCGHERDASDKAYFEMREAQAQKHAAPVAQTHTASSASKITRRRAIIAAVIFVFIGLCAFSIAPHPHEFHVTAKSWERTVEVEQYLYVDEDGWSLPSGADLLYTRSEIHHYNHVLDHYETRTRSYQERVQSGSHTEYRYHNNGDGTFTEESYEVPDYTYETRYETYEEPVYRDDPVYQTKYYYKIWRWRYKTTVVNSGEGDDPVDPTVELAADERLGARGETYRVHGYYEGDSESKAFDIEVDAARFRSLSVGDVVRVDAGLDGTFRRFMDD